MFGNQSNLPSYSETGSLSESDNHIFEFDEHQSYHTDLNQSDSDTGSSTMPHGRLRRLTPAPATGQLQLVFPAEYVEGFRSGNVEFNIPGVMRYYIKPTDSVELKFRFSNPSAKESEQDQIEESHCVGSTNIQGSQSDTTLSMSLPPHLTGFQLKSPQHFTMSEPTEDTSGNKSGFFTSKHSEDVNQFGTDTHVFSGDHFQSVDSGLLSTQGPLSSAMFGQSVVHTEHSNLGDNLTSSLSYSSRFSNYY
ncbi:hypothetical protein Ciccas_000723 [Cichlidogyrus casuarinus]|uniref:Uncharacterized protein n=1 Tax=Cichlidogyrus casuarinus TaxID=1844966 RepID=A0ABD2QPB3_9PLAT